MDKTIPGYEVYAKAMEELDKKMDLYSELDNHGVAKQVASPTKEQRQMLKENDERSLIDFNKKMAEEAKKLQEKGNNGPVPGL